MTEDTKSGEIKKGNRSQRRESSLHRGWVHRAGINEVIIFPAIFDKKPDPVIWVDINRPKLFFLKKKALQFLGMQGRVPEIIHQYEKSFISLFLDGYWKQIVAILKILGIKNIHNYISFYGFKDKINSSTLV